MIQEILEKPSEFARKRPTSLQIMPSVVHQRENTKISPEEGMNARKRLRDQVEVELDQVIEQIIIQDQKRQVPLSEELIQARHQQMTLRLLTPIPERMIGLDTQTELVVRLQALVTLIEQIAKEKKRIYDDLCRNQGNPIGQEQQWYRIKKILEIDKLLHFLIAAQTHPTLKDIRIHPIIYHQSVDLKNQRNQVRQINQEQRGNPILGNPKSTHSITWPGPEIETPITQMTKTPNKISPTYPYNEEEEKNTIKLEKQKSKSMIKIVEDIYYEGWDHEWRYAKSTFVMSSLCLLLQFLTVMR